MTTIPATCPVAHGFDPLAEDYLADPYAQLDELREQSPVHYVPAIDYWLVTRHADVAAVFTDPGTFSARNAQDPLLPLTEEAASILRAGLGLVPVLSNLDPPTHGRIRTNLGSLFLPRAMAKLRDMIAERTSELIDQFAPVGHAELVSQLSFPLPAATLFRIIGFPESDAAQIKAWCEDKLEVNWGRPSEESQKRSAENMVAFYRYVSDFVAKKVQALGGDDLVSELIRRRAGKDDGLTDEEIVSIVFALSFAGHETTTNLISNAMRQLLSRRDLWDQVCADPAIIPGVVEETLRYDSSVIAWRRVTTRDVEIGGVSVPAGAKLMLGLGAANHDPAEFPDPEVFMPGRPNARAHVSFGKGAHFCLGQHLARIEDEVVIGLLASRLPGMRLKTQELEFPRNISFRGPKALHVEWDAP